jgi:hypothetical protein
MAAEPADSRRMRATEQIPPFRSLDLAKHGALGLRPLIWMDYRQSTRVPGTHKINTAQQQERERSTRVNVGSDVMPELSN